MAERNSGERSDAPRHRGLQLAVRREDLARRRRVGRLRFRIRHTQRLGVVAVYLGDLGLHGRGARLGQVAAGGAAGPGRGAQWLVLGNEPVAQAASNRRWCVKAAARSDAGGREIEWSLRAHFNCHGRFWSAYSASQLERKLVCET